MDLRVLLSTFSGRAGLASAAMSVANHERLASHVTPDTAKLAGSASAKRLVPPAAPTFRATAVSATQINLAWARVAGATRYLVDEWKSGHWTQVGSVGSGSISFAVSGLSPSTTYSFDVAASNATGTSWARNQSATTLGPPAAPTFTVTAVSATQVKLTWIRVAGATRYLVDEWENNAWSQLGSVGSGGSSYAVYGLSPSTIYYFDVAAYNALGTTWGKVQGATTLAATVAPPIAPSFTATAVSATQINLVWNGVAGATGYPVDEWKNGLWMQLGSMGSGSTSYAVNGLSTGTTYYFDVGASNAAGTAWGNFQGATTLAPPVAPSFTATPLSATEIDLAWTVVAGATGYLVDEWENGAWAQVGSEGSGSTTYAVDGLSPGITYYFDLGASNALGTTWANNQSATTLAPPVAPSFTATPVSATQINLAWTNVAGATGYLVDEWENGVWTQVGSLGSSSTSYGVSGLSPGTTYYFDVGASNAAGTTWANSQSSTTLAAPVAPSFTATAVSTTQINLAWTDVAGAASYLVDEWENGAWVQIGSVDSGSTSYEVTGLSSGITYYFDLGASSTAGTTWANVQSATTLALPVAPSLTATAVSSTQVNLVWSDVTGATGYLVDEWENAAWVQIGSTGSNGTSYAVNNLSPSTTYYFDLGASNAAGTAWANSQSATTFAASVAPTFTAAAVSATEIDLAWTPVASATSYVVDEWENGAWTELATVGSGTTGYAVTGLSASTTYYFDVGASNTAGTTWADFQSATTPATTVGPPGAPNFTATAVSATEIDLAWTVVGGATGYLIDEWENGAWVQIGNVGSASTSFAVTALSPDTTYTFDVGASNAAGTTWANYQSTTTLARPAAPSFTATAASATQINLAWADVAGATSYLVDEWENGAWVQIASVGGSSNSYAVDGLSPGTSYTFDVGASNAAGTTWANYQSATTLAAAPSFTVTAVSATQINLAWSAIAGATGYLVNEWENGAWVQVDNAGSSSTSYAANALSPNTTYYFDLGVSTAAGTTWANYQSATTFPAVLSFTATAASATQINLAWTSVNGATSYLINEWESGAWVQIGSVGSGSTSYAVNNLSPNTTYTFDVGASSASGTTWADQQSATTLDATVAPPAAPSFTATAVSSTQINLAWTDVTGATGYVVDEWENGAWVQLGSVGSSSTSYAVNSLSPGTTYYFDVGASNAAGTTWANNQSATTLALPVAPSFTATAVSATQINLAWTSVTGATGYLVDEWENGAWAQIGSVGSGTTGYAVNGLTANTTYSFQVGAVNGAGTTWANSQSATTLQNNFVVNHPTAAVAYSQVNGSLFGANGPSYLDVQQGAEGDCWLLASLAEVAARVPSDIKNMFTYNGTATENGATVGIYTVRFFNGAGAAQYVTVDTELPAGGTYYDQPVNHVLWVALAEKAYAEANGAGFVTTSNPGVDSYDALNSGQPFWALEAITGKSASGYGLNPGNIAADWNAGDLIVLATGATTVDSRIVPDHAYAVVGYTASNNLPFQVFNPWGTTSNGTPQGDPNVYGLFYATAGFLSQNFIGQSIGTGAAAGLDAHGFQPASGLNSNANPSQELAVLVIGLDHQWLKHMR